MRRRFASILLLSVILADNVTAKCVFAPNIRANVLVQSCVAVTFAPSSLGIEFTKGDLVPWYKKESSYSGTLISVKVKNAKFVWDNSEKHLANGFRVWAYEQTLTLFVAKSVDETCPAALGDLITVETDRYCCDKLPLADRCLVPSSLISVIELSK
jgi:hypothetical protein